MSGFVGHAERAAISMRLAEVLPKDESDRSVARRLGCANSNLTRWLMQKHMPDAASLLAIRREFGVSIDWLLTGEGKAFAVAEPTPEEEAE